jgi:hypothetical protein
MYESKTTWKEERVLLIMGFFACIGIILYIHFFKTRDKTDISTGDLITVDNLVLKEDPVYGKTKGSEYIRLKFIGYEKTFSIGDYDVTNITKRQVISEVRSGDTVSVGMTKTEFDNINNYSLFDSRVEINSLRKKGKEYLNIAIRNINAFNGSWDVVPALIYAAVMCLIFSSYSHRPKYSPTLIICIGTSIIILITAKYF